MKSFFPNVLNNKMLIVIILFLIPNLLFSQQRKIRPGDSIEIVVYGHSELSRTVFVSSQGTIDFPFMQNIPVDGLSIEKVREVIVAQLSRYLPTPPVVTAVFAGTSAITVSVLGQVAIPGVVQLPLQSRLQGALQKAGNVLPGADIGSITVLTTENGTTTTSNYNMELFLLNGDLAQNPTLTDNDIIIVTGNPIFDKVKVLGAVNRPGSYDAFHNASIMDMIFLAGGFAEDAETEKIMYISLAEQTTTELEINLNKYFDVPQQYSHLPNIKPGDIIMVPKKKRKIWAALWSVTRDVLILGQSFYYIWRISKER
ncbi:MAG: polysaccharide biosynthesis/export family protein [bacterium]|nr:polysaccharide biosynthesis/export family protein [bacterium]